jgi:hypothetical protein
LLLGEVEESCFHTDRGGIDHGMTLLLLLLLLLLLEYNDNEKRDQLIKGKDKEKERGGKRKLANYSNYTLSM